jgi:hypothetical protein
MDGVGATLGSAVITFDRSVVDLIDEDDVVPLNVLLNGSFDYWITGEDLPDHWSKKGLGTLDLDQVSPSPVLSGRYSARFGYAAATGAGTGIMQEIGELIGVWDYLTNNPVCFGVWVYRPASSYAQNNWKVQIEDGSGNTYYTLFNPGDLPAATWTLVTVIGVVDDDDVTVSTYAVDGEASGDVLFIDGAFLNIGSKPMPGAGRGGARSMWVRRWYDFTYQGELSANNYLDTDQRIEGPFYPTRMDVYCGRGPGELGPGGYVDFELHSANGGSSLAKDNLECRVEAVAAPDVDGVGAAATNTLANAYLDHMYDKKHINVYMTASGINDNPEDIHVRITGYTSSV